jgi:hypothetical protein
VDDDDKASGRTETQSQYIYITMLREEGMRTKPQSTGDTSVVMAARVLFALNSKGWYLYEVYVM